MMDRTSNKVLKFSEEWMLHNKKSISPNVFSLAHKILLYIKFQKKKDIRSNNFKLCNIASLYEKEGLSLLKKNM